MFIGADVIVLPGVKIGDNSIIGAGAVEMKDLPAGKVCVGGLPARCIGEFRDFIDARGRNVNLEKALQKLWEKFCSERQ